MKRIPLTQGKFAIVDDEDYDYLMQWKWQARKSHRTYYAVRTCYCFPPNKATRHTIRMHRVIMDVPQGKETDHINHDGLDNRKQNIRVCTRVENGRNQRPRKNTSSRYKGVSVFETQWRAQIGHNGKKKHIGLYRSEVDAAKAYDKEAKRLFGEFAYVNFR